jgi:HEPN domain-containing protein
MEKNEHINYWVNSALRDWEVVHDLVAAGRYMYALFFAHLTVEKLLKAHWVKEHEESYPPLLHNLTALYDQIKLNLGSNFTDELPIISSWNIEARYQDYKERFYKLCTRAYTENKLKIVEEMVKCLTKKL